MIASLGPDIPQELLKATGRYAGPLGWNIERQFPQAEHWLESKFPLWAFSVVEDWAAGALDHLDIVVFSRSDDAAQRLYYYVCELRTRGLLVGPEPVIFDVARIGRASSEARCVHAVRVLAQRLRVDDAALVTAISNPPRNGEVPQRGGGVGTSPSSALLAGEVSTPPSASRPPPRSGEDCEKRLPLCLLSGTPPPDDRLHCAVAEAGWLASGKTLSEAWLDESPAVAGPSDPCAVLGKRLHASRSGVRSFADRSTALVAQLRASQAKAVILWYAEEDEAEVWNLPAQRRALEAEGVPVLVLTRRDWRTNDGAGVEIAAFLKGLGA